MRLTVAEPIAIPGALLQPGEYVVKLVDSPSQRQVVRFLSHDQSTVIATVLAVPNAQLQRPRNTELLSYTTRSGEPFALRAWFYPGSRQAVEFVYSEERARTIASQSGLHVPAMAPGVELASAKVRPKPDDAPDVILQRTRIYSIAPQGAAGRYEDASQRNAQTDVARPADAGSRPPRASFQPGRSATAPSRGRSNRLAREVGHEIFLLPRYGIFDDIRFRVNGGVVTLMGKVQEPELRASAEEVVREIEGVAEVRNRIEVLPHAEGDDDLRQATFKAIYGNTSLERYGVRAVPPIHIIVSNGNVTLEGHVASELDRQLAGSQARTVEGARSVTNNLRIE